MYIAVLWDNWNIIFSSGVYCCNNARYKILINFTFWQYLMAKMNSETVKKWSWQFYISNHNATIKEFYKLSSFFTSINNYSQEISWDKGEVDRKRWRTFYSYHQISATEETENYEIQRLWCQKNMQVMMRQSQHLCQHQFLQNVAELKR